MKIIIICIKPKNVGYLVVLGFRPMYDSLIQIHNSMLLILSSFLDIGWKYKIL
jgi:hypothetical protein